MALATARIAAERKRLERLGVIDAASNLLSTDLPPDMLPESETTLETGCYAVSHPRMIIGAGLARQRQDEILRRAASQSRRARRDPLVQPLLCRVQRELIRA